MSRVCNISGKRVRVGNNVSHSKIKTKRKFAPNLQSVTLKSELLDADISMKIATSTIRTIEKNGGLDQYLLNTSSRKLSEDAAKLKRKLAKIANKD